MLTNHVNETGNVGRVGFVKHIDDVGHVEDAARVGHVNHIGQIGHLGTEGNVGHVASKALASINEKFKFVYQMLVSKMIFQMYLLFLLIKTDVLER